MDLDEKDCIILNLLQINCRASLTSIAKEVGLSVDAVNKRIKKLLEHNIFWPKIQIRPRQLGFHNIVDVKLKLIYTSRKDVDHFISYLRAHPRVCEIFSISGDWDFSLVILAKDAIDLGKTTRDIRCKFGHIISAWTESLTTNSYKFEYYDVAELLGKPSSRIKPDF